MPNLKNILQSLLKQKYSHITNRLFDKQRLFIEDTSTRKVAVCPRRAGKTTTAITYLILSALQYPASISLYLGLTRQDAKGLIWQPLQDELAKLKVKFEAYVSELKIYLENKSIIWLSSGEQTINYEQFRGFPYKLVVFDESASYRDLKPLVDILSPSLFEIGGTLAFIGTPGITKSGYFYDVAEGKLKNLYSQHRWSMYDNIHFGAFQGQPRESWEKIVDDYRISEGLSIDSPTWQREYLGQWIAGDDEKVFRFDQTKNTALSIPPSHTLWYLGIDLGWKDKTAFVEIAYSKNSDTLYVANIMSKSKMLIDDIANEVKRRTQNKKYVVITVDSANAQVVNELRIRHHLPLIDATKINKLGFIEIANNLLVSGRIKTVDSLDLNYQLSNLIYNDKKTDIKDKQTDDLAMAFLYTLRQIPNIEPKPFEPTKSAFELAEEKTNRLINEKIEKERRNELARIRDTRRILI